MSDSTKSGILNYNYEERRYEIIFKDGSDSLSLHCGDCFEVYDGTAWHPTWIERNGGWYLTNCANVSMDGAEVRV